MTWTRILPREVKSQRLDTPRAAPSPLPCTNRRHRSSEESQAAVRDFRRGFQPPGRFRTDWTTNLKFRLIRGRNLWWNLGQTVNFDSQPPATFPGSDYVTTTSISWAFP